MKVYEVTAAGFDGGTDETDDRVYWVGAPDEETVRSALVGTGAQFRGEIFARFAAVDFVLPDRAERFHRALRAWDLKADPSTR